MTELHPHASPHESATSGRSGVAAELAGVPPAGSVIGGKLLVGEVLGRGGMGVVVAGEHLQLRQKIAIKFLRPSLAQTPDALTRFLREARAAASLRSDHAARIYDVGTTDSGIPYIVMERLTGVSLEKRIADEAPLDVASSARMIIEACDALAEAHGAGIVHRDVKPANLFCAQGADGRGSVKVLDFGISKSLVPEGDSVISASVTAPHTLLGSPQYMSPEQIRDASAVDPRSDIWGLGVILYELLTGRAPFASDSIPHLYALILSSHPTSPRAHRAALPSGLDAVVMRCLEKATEKRYQDVASLVRALGPYAREGAEPRADDVVLEAGGRVRRRRVWVAAAAGAAALCSSAMLLPQRASRASSEAGREGTMAAPSPTVDPIAHAEPSAAPAASAPAPATPPRLVPTPATTPSAASTPSATPRRVRDIRSIKLLE